jgi:hypothetical protein
MKALIDPRVKVNHIKSWNKDTPIYETYENSGRICQVEETSFEVALPLFWVECDDDVVSGKNYYDTDDETIKEVINALRPAPV